MSYDAKHETKHHSDYNKKKTKNDKNHMTGQGNEEFRMTGIFFVVCSAALRDPDRLTLSFQSYTLIIILLYERRN